MGVDGERDPDVIEVAGGGEEQPSAHLRSREEYTRALRVYRERMPGRPLPRSLREPEATQPTSDVETSDLVSKTSGLPPVGSAEGAEVGRHQDRVHTERRAPHTFRSRPPVYEQSTDGHAIGVGYLLLTLREVTGMSQRRLAKAAGTSQSAITRAESGAHTPSLPALFRYAYAAGYRVTIGFTAPEVAELDPATVTIEDLALLGVLVRDPLDGLPAFRVLREPPPWAGPS